MFQCPPNQKRDYVVVLRRRPKLCSGAVHFIYFTFNNLIFAVNQ